MKKLSLKHVVIGIAAVAIGSAIAISSFKKPTAANFEKVPEATAKKIQASFFKLPLSFEVNEGQVDEQVKFLSRGSGFDLYLTPQEALIATKRSLPSETENAQEATIEVNALRLSLVDANESAQMSGVDPLPGKSNYFIGNDPKKWRTNIAHYRKVKYEAVYPGIDLIYYGNQRKLEYDFIVSPGADPNKITLSFKGADKLTIDSKGDLVLALAGEEIRQQKPIVYQEIDGKKKKLSGQYVFKGPDQVGFQVAAYDRTRALIIDPVLVYSTYLGGTANESEEIGIAVDSSGHAYVAGLTRSVNFPTTMGAFQTAFAGVVDVFVTKLLPDGSGLVYSTYLGGTGPESSDKGVSIAVDSLGNAYVASSTGSVNFPTTMGAFQTAFAGGFRDVFVTKLLPDGSGLVYSTYLGGTGLDRDGQIAVDSLGNAYVTGLTVSSNFPTTMGAFQTALAGSTDAFVTKLLPDGSGLVYSTYLGGTSTDRNGQIAVDSLGNAYVTGLTSSSNFPTTMGAFQTALAGSTDAFVTKLLPDGSGLVYSTYLGGTSGDDGIGIAVDSLGNAYVTGSTSSSNFPTTMGAFQTAFAGGFRDAFVTKLLLNGTGLVYSTYLGGTNSDGGHGIAVDSFGNAYVTGITNSSNFPTTMGAFQTALVGITDAFVTKLLLNGSQLVYSTYLGGG